MKISNSGLWSRKTSYIQWKEIDYLHSYSEIYNKGGIDTTLFIQKKDGEEFRVNVSDSDAIDKLNEFISINRIQVKNLGHKFL